jgi:hypothetical protein
VKRYLSYWLIIICFGLSLKSQAQDVKVEAKVDKVSVPMGDQTTLRIIAHIPAKSDIQFPVIADSIGKIQIVKFKADTTADTSGTDRQIISHNYTITGFNPGTYTVPAYTFRTKTETYTTDSLVVQFKPVAVDTTKAFYDIKQPLTVNYTFWDWLKDHWIWVVSGLVFIGLVIYITLYISKRYDKNPILKNIPIVLTIDEIAINKLNELRAKNLWQQEQYKQYYIELTDILRDYIEKRYKVQAHEQTTDELLTSLSSKDMPQQARVKLKEILVLADLVKFAKEKPLPADNELTMEKAISFVELTKEIIIRPENKNDKEELPK